MPYQLSVSFTSFPFTKYFLDAYLESIWSLEVWSLGCCLLVPWVSMPCPFFPLTKDSVTIDATLTTPMMEGLPLKITTRHLFLPDLHHLLDPSRVWPISQSLALVPLTTSFLALGSLVLGCECAVSYTLASPACQARPIHSYILFTSYFLWPDIFEMEFWSFLLVLIFNTSNAYIHTLTIIISEKTWAQGNHHIFDSVSESSRLELEVFPGCRDAHFCN